MSASDAFAAVAILVALAAFIVAFWQGLLTRRHNRLSVTPHLSCQSHLGGTSGRFGLTVSNFGIGPARIKQVAVFVDDEKMEGSDDDGWEDAIDKLRYASTSEKQGEKSGFINRFEPKPATRCRHSCGPEPPDPARGLWPERLARVTKLAQPPAESPIGQRWPTALQGLQLQ